MTAAKTKICSGYIMHSSFGVLDAFAFLVFAVLLIAGVIIVVSLAAGPPFNGIS